MKQKADGITSRGQNLECNHANGPNWVLLVGGALLSTLSIRMGCRLKQIFKGKRLDNVHDKVEEKGKSAARRRLVDYPLHTNMYYYKQDDDSCYHCLSGMPEGQVDIKQESTSPVSKDGDHCLPLVTISTPESCRENGVMWTSSPELLELPPKPFHHSNGADSPCVSECGSDMFNKREVMQRLRQQLRQRDELIIEMQAQITDLQNSLASQISHSANLQLQIDSAKRKLFSAEREMQHLRKAIADHHVVELGSPVNTSSAPKWHSEMKGHENGCIERVNDPQLYCNGEGVEMLRREVQELKEVIQGKEFLLQSYKEEKVELCTKVMDLQSRLGSQVPSIL